MRVITDVDEMTAILANGMFLEHHLYEDMARATRGVARVRGWRGERLDRDFGREMGISVYRPTEHKPPVVAFANTRLVDGGAPEAIIEQLTQLASDLHEDLFPMAIGYFRYCYNEGRLKNLLEELVSNYRSKVIVTGHSLGGSLAQLTGARMPELVEAVVTFQSPGTTLGVVRDLYAAESPAVAEDLQCQSYHYKIAGDEVIQEAGEISSPGDVIRLTYMDGEIETPAAWYAHIEQIFDEMDRTQASARAIRPIVERKLSQIEIDTIGDPSGEVQSTLSTIIEWLRASGLMMAIAIPTIATRSAAPIVRLALPLLQEVIYCALWTMNIADFRADPENNLELDDGIPGFPLLALVSDAQLRQLRSEFRRYIEHSRLRA